jgi:hypothetical protein
MCCPLLNNSRPDVCGVFFLGISLDMTEIISQANAGLGESGVVEKKEMKEKFF